MAAKWSIALFLNLLLFVAVAVKIKGEGLDLSAWEGKMYGQMHLEDVKSYLLLDLPYGGGYNGLEPFLDERTLRVHHSGHHKKYTDNMNRLLLSWRESGLEAGLAGGSLLDITQNLNAVPEKWRTGITNNMGGFVNHNLYWAVMCNEPQDASHTPQPSVLQRITQVFGTFAEFKARFTEASLGVFGSGYTWLVEDGNGNLDILKTSNQDCPLSAGLYPLLVVDLWEHAYYLKHTNQRRLYLEEWWKVVCWREVEELAQYWKALRKTRGGEGERNNEVHVEL